MLPGDSKSNAQTWPVERILVWLGRQLLDTVRTLGKFLTHEVGTVRNQEQREMISKEQSYIQPTSRHGVKEPRKLYSHRQEGQKLANVQTATWSL